MYQAMVGFSYDFYGSSALPVSHNDTSGYVYVNESYSVDSDDDGKNVKRTSTLETTASTWVSQSSSEGNDYNASTEEDVDSMVDAIANCNFDIAWDIDVEDRNDDNKNAHTSVREVDLVKEKETEPAVKYEAFDCVVEEMACNDVIYCHPPYTPGKSCNL